MFAFAHKYASLRHFYALSRRLSPWLGGVSAVLIVAGLVGGLVLAPSDYQQGDSFRIIYVHVPSAWMSLFVYSVMVGAAVSILIWKVKVAEITLRCAAPLGAWFTLMTLVTGAIWGKPMWGAYWVWDARLTSELVLLFIYLGIMALAAAFDDRRVAARACAVVTLVGFINIPIIHYSVEWWSTLHQGPTVSKFDAPSIHINMLIPLLVMAVSFTCFFAASLLVRMRVEILNYDRNSSWVRDLVRDGAVSRG